MAHFWVCRAFLRGKLTVLRPCATYSPDGKLFVCYIYEARSRQVYGYLMGCHIYHMGCVLVTWGPMWYLVCMIHIYTYTYHCAYTLLEDVHDVCIYLPIHIYIYTYIHTFLGRQAVGVLTTFSCNQLSTPAVTCFFKCRPQLFWAHLTSR